MTYIQDAVIIPLSEQVRLIELEIEQVYYVRKTFTGNSRKLWKAYFFTKTMEYSRSEINANAALLSQELCCKH